MVDDLHRAVAERLRSAKQRYTKNRRAVVDILDAADHPLTAAEMLEKRRLAQSSLYRNLVILEESGIAHRVTSTDEFARFELAEDLTDDHHHHLICQRCGSVADFTVSAQLERTLERAMAKVADDTGFVPNRHRLDLVGQCALCA